MAFRNSIASGLTLVREALQSFGFVTGTAGWSINRDGSAEFSDAMIRGTVESAEIIGGRIIMGDAPYQIEMCGPPNIPASLTTFYGSSVIKSAILFRGLLSSVFVYYARIDFGQVAGQIDAAGNVVEIWRIPEQVGIDGRGEMFFGSASPLDLVIGTTLKPATVNINGVLSISGSMVALVADPEAGVAVSTAVQRNDGVSLLPNREIHAAKVAVAGNTTSPTFVDAPIPTFSGGFTKRFTDTRMQYGLSVSAWVSGMTVPTEVEFSVRNGAAGADRVLTSMIFANNNQHLALPFGMFDDGASAGAKTFVFKWRRVSGDGTINMDGADRYAFSVEETAP